MAAARKCNLSSPCPSAKSAGTSPVALALVIKPAPRAWPAGGAVGSTTCSKVGAAGVFEGAPQLQARQCCPRSCACSAAKEVQQGPQQSSRQPATAHSQSIPDSRPSFLLLEHVGRKPVRPAFGRAGHGPRCCRAGASSLQAPWRPHDWRTAGVLQLPAGRGQLTLARATRGPDSWAGGRQQNGRQKRQRDAGLRVQGGEGALLKAVARAGRLRALRLGLQKRAMLQPPSRGNANRRPLEPQAHLEKPRHVKEGSENQGRASGPVCAGGRAGVTEHAWARRLARPGGRWILH